MSLACKRRGILTNQAGAMHTQATAEPAADITTFKPVAEGERIDSMDAVRGMALFGILCVNIHLFAAPFGEFISPVPRSNELLDQAVFYFTKIFCEGKFYAIFSTLFGAGLTLQYIKSHQAGQSFKEPGIRRLLLLLLIGFLHAIVLWYGDILFLYGCIGIVMLVVLHMRPSPKSMVIAAVCILSLSTVLQALFALAMVPEKPTPALMAPAAITAPASELPKPAEPSSASAGETQAPAVAQPDAASAGAGAPIADASPETAESPRMRKSGIPDEQAAAHPFLRLLKGFEEGRIQGGPDQPLWMEAERDALKNGPYLDAMGMRAMTWLIFLVICWFGFGWNVLALFLIGAALAAKRGFSAESLALQKKLAMFGIGIGLPLCIIAVIIPAQMGVTGVSMMLMALFIGPGSTLLGLGYLGAMCLLASTGKLAGVRSLFANIGRLGLTNYLLQTLVCTFIFNHWGLAQFGDWSHTKRFGLVVAIYAAQIVLSWLYLRVFRIGPMEYLWRCATYLRGEPILRR